LLQFSDPSWGIPIAYKASQNALGGGADVTFLYTLNFQACGIGSTTPTSNDKNLESQIGNRMEGARGYHYYPAAQPAIFTYTTAVQFSYDDSYNVTEWALFTAIENGIMVDRTTFDPIAVKVGDRITFSFSLFLSPGTTEVSCDALEALLDQMVEAACGTGGDCDYEALLTLVETLEHYLKTISPALWGQGVQGTRQNPPLTERQFHDLDTKIKSLQDYNAARRDVDIMKNRSRKR